MECPGQKDGPLARLGRGRAWKIAAGLLAFPPLAWGLAVAFLPMDWARARIVAALADSTGRRVHLAAVRLAPMGGLRLDGLEIADEGREDVPWLKVHRLAIDLNPLRLASGCLALKEIHADGLELKLRRRSDGSVDLADLFKARPRASSGANSAGDDAEVAFRIERSRISILDELSDNHLDLVQVKAEGTWQRSFASLQTLRAQLNGGLVDLSAHLDRGPTGPAFEGQLRAKGVRLGAGMAALSYLLPVLADARPSDNYDGRFDLELYLQGRGSSPMELGRSLSGRGLIALGPISLARSEFVAELIRAARVPARDRVGSIRSDFEIGGGRVRSRDLTLRVAGIPIVLAGWTDFLGRIDYQVRSDGMAEKLAREARGLVEDTAIDPRQMASLSVRGSLDHLVWTLDGIPIHARPGDPGPNVEDRVRQIGRRLREHYQR